MKANIPEVPVKRVVIIGGGFAGLTLARKLVKHPFQVVLIDKNNYHQFQPLFYQVATSGLEPSAISFPFRKIFQKKKNIHIRITEVVRIEPENNRVITQIGKVNYDYLIMAQGAGTNYFGNKAFETRAMPMKAVPEALHIRNTVLQNFENALITEDENDRSGLLNIVIVGGGPTGVEMAGALAEMRSYVLPKDYPELDFMRMQIYLLEAGNRVLKGMSESASANAFNYLKNLHVNVQLGSQVRDFDGKLVMLADGSTIRSNTLIWAAGVKANIIEGLKPEVYGAAQRIVVDVYNRIKGYDNIFAIGDVAVMSCADYPNGHPQVAQVALQMADNLAKNLLLKNQEKRTVFSYHDLGSMATVGRNLAVVDLPFVKFKGFFAWMVWMFIHLISIVGVKNRIFVFLNWFWNYLTYDQSLRLIMKPAERKKTTDEQ